MKHKRYFIFNVFYWASTGFEYRPGQQWQWSLRVLFRLCRLKWELSLETRHNKNRICSCHMTVCLLQSAFFNLRRRNIIFGSVFSINVSTVCGFLRNILFKHKALIFNLFLTIQLTGRLVHTITHHWYKCTPLDTILKQFYHQSWHSLLLRSS